MIDFIKLRLPKKCADSLRKSALLQFHTPVNLQTGETGLIETAEYFNMKVVISPKQLIIAGSLHKFYNSYMSSHSQNYDDFTLSKLLAAIALLCQSLEFEPEQAEILNIEFGVNIPIERVPESYLKENVVSYLGMAPSITNRFNNRGYFNEFTCYQYYLKIYDKSKQFGINKPLLRIEIKTRKSLVVGKVGIENLSNLMDIQKLVELKNLLLKRLEKLLVIDATDFEFITSAEDRMFLYHYTNPRAFEVIANRRKRASIRKELYKKLEKYDLLKYWKELKMAVNSKWDELLSCSD